jgi:hypothetical protein
MVCPECGNLLLRYSAKYDELPPEKEHDLVLGPADFYKETSSNDVCYVCGAHLWGVDCKPVGRDTLPERKWYKVSHFKNHTRKNTSTAWVLKGHEQDYYSKFEVETSEIRKVKTVDENGNEVIREEVVSLVKKSPAKYGPRKYAPALFIKKYLKGYFDFCVLDECHKYENGGTAQAGAAHALMKVSDFTLGLTGTISNGKADSFFYLFYMLDPARMKKFGYEYSDRLAFSQTYGCVETVYEASVEDEETVKNASSRGRQISKPEVKPGISPRLVIDFLWDKSVFLDLSDLSSQLPPLKEMVVPCGLPEEVAQSYGHVLDRLKEASREKGNGRAVLSTMLQFGLSYPDKPWGVKPIMSPHIKDCVLARPANFDQFAGDDTLLPKEEKLVDIVSQEISEGRNCFVYCAYTGSEELNVTQRLKNIIEKRCNLKGRVLVMNSKSPEATEREEYIHKKASEGIKVFICNMRLVETGLDFCFKYDGQYYNYPTIVFYQTTYELAVMWQASRRHFRLNQKEECRTYYLCTEGTLQMAAMQIMAEKQVAASAIQGKFSADGLAAMAKGVDPRVKLAAMLSAGDMGTDTKTLENMFDVMNRSDESGEDEYSGYEPPKTFYEIMEGESAVFETKKKEITVKKVVPVKETVKKTVEVAPREEDFKDAFSLFDMFEDMSLFGENEPAVKTEVKTVKTVTTVKTETVKTEAKKTKAVKPVKVKAEDNGQMSFFDMFAA